MTRAPITSRSSVCVLVPHYGCEEWLGQALESVLGQTRPPQAVVVIDDGSPEPPVDVVRDLPDVTLLASADNGGPYRLVQAVIDATDHDAYLFQDADDWSAPDRLEVLLTTAQTERAALVGSHEVRVLVDEGDVVPVRYPLDVNAALGAKPTDFPLLHPTSIVSRDLVVRLGGFATGMRFSGDAELLRRASHVARIVNADHFGYFRRKRAGSLTTDPATSLASPARREVQEVLAQRARANAEARARSAAPDLRPWRTAAPPELRHLAGPSLDTRRPPVRRVHRTVAAASPVIAIGAPRAGQSLLGWALGQHPDLKLLPDARWLARAASDVVVRAGEEAAPVPRGFMPELATSLDRLAGGGGWVAAGTELTGAALALAELFPTARFVHLVRDVDEVAACLAETPTDGGAFYTAESARRAWVAAARTGLDLEAALGPGRVLRLRYDELVGEPAAALETCFGWLELPPHAACIRPLTGVRRTPLVTAADAASGPAEARGLSDELLHGRRPAGGDPQAVERLRAGLRARSTTPGGSLLVEKVKGVVTSVVPEGAVVAMVSRGDPRLVELPARVGWHFPQVGDNTYAGHHPASSDDAVAHLEELRDRGAEYLVFPATGLWWLSHYDGLRDHLARYPVAAYVEGACVVFRLAADVDLRGDRPWPAGFWLPQIDHRGRPRPQVIS